MFMWRYLSLKYSLSLAVSLGSVSNLLETRKQGQGHENGGFAILSDGEF